MRSAKPKLGGVSDPYLIRLATPADAADIGRLLHDFNREFEDYTPGAEAIAERAKALLERGEITVVLGGEGPDGFAVLRLRPGLTGEGLEAYLQEMYVAPDRRGQGLGRAVLERAIEVAREAGARSMELATAETDRAARALYESCGFSNLEGTPGGPPMLFYEREL